MNDAQESLKITWGDSSGLNFVLRTNNYRRARLVVQHHLKLPVNCELMIGQDNMHSAFKSFGLGGLEWTGPT